MSVPDDSIDIQPFINEIATEVLDELYERLPALRDLGDRATAAVTIAAAKAAHLGILRGISLSPDPTRVVLRDVAIEDPWDEHWADREEGS